MVKHWRFGSVWLFRELAVAFENGVDNFRHLTELIRKKYSALKDVTLKDGELEKITAVFRLFDVFNFTLKRFLVDFLSRANRQLCGQIDHLNFEENIFLYRMCAYSRV